MRALVQVINQIYKQKILPETNEYVVCLSALQKMILPTLTMHDHIIYKDIIKDIFVGITTPETK